MGTVGIAIAGFGRFGALHADVVRDNPDARLIAICARSSGSLQKAAQLGVFVTGSFTQVLSRPDVDAVIIAVPNHLHFEFALAALQAGKHVLVEKPMALTAKEADTLLQAAAQEHVVLAVGHELRFSPLWKEVRARIQQGQIGTPRSVVLKLWRGPFRQGAGGWRYDRSRVGNWLFEEALHFLDLARWFMENGRNPVVRVTAKASSCTEGGDLSEDTSVTLMEWANGAWGVVVQSVVGYGHEIQGEVVGTGGALRARWAGELDRDPMPQVRLTLWDGGSAIDIPVPSTPGEAHELKLQLQNFLATIQGRAEPAARGEDGAWAVAICEAAVRSVVERTWVDVRVPWERAPRQP